VTKEEFEVWWTQWSELMAEDAPAAPAEVNPEPELELKPEPEPESLPSIPVLPLESERAQEPGWL
jgi:hypothetical protein